MPLFRCLVWVACLSDTTHVLAAASAGSGMSSAQVSVYYGALQTYMAVGEPTQWAADVNFAGDGSISAWPPS